MARDSRLVPERPLVVGSFAVLLLVSAALFAAVFPAYVTAETAYRVDVTATDYTIEDEGKHLVVTLELHNPTDHAIEIQSLSSSAKLGLWTSGERMTHATDTAVEGARIPANGNGTVTVDFVVNQEYRKTIREYVESGRAVIRGELEGRVVRERVGISVDGIEVRDDG